MSGVFEKADRLHKRAWFFFIGSVDGGGFPNIKAVLPSKHRERLNELYFSTNTSSKHVQQFRANPRGCVYFFSIFNFKGVLLRGSFEVLQDRETRERFWRKGDEQYYPRGIADPDYCILKFTAQTGRYYCSYKSEDFSFGQQD
ncbi:pyridoxamine 5'-phosphate oxidase family protein [Breznakiella homolactica]|uniref:Pyridoxamine 5'-phosphate oxidase family protein n=1 Tax=Breznakiella homolactica TaxID=2798577 RepID=A0A7T8BBH9_9SPIR|nr:pyridoxamine 5'-phosphate oxidase family protein [Breznakiella homolactica]QQO10055.1 pyridoxamine 5'-phosphate oxidase family protein [Breznakiella homolactica]